MPCTICFKSEELCFCSKITPVENQIKVVILQHPQEKKEALSTAPLLVSGLKNVKLVRGLSWSNLSKALKSDRPQDPNFSKSWGVLFLGGKGEKGAPRKKPGLYEVVKGGLTRPLDSGLRGLILLDGNWSQAKTLWWRNAWLMKHTRLSLVPEKKSLYGKLRKEPRAECLSTLETAAYALKYLEDSDAGDHLIKVFSEFLENYQNKTKSTSLPKES